MKALYRELSKVSALALAIASLASCSFASVSSKPGVYSFNGYTRDPEVLAQVLSENYVQEYNSQQYWKAVEEGRAYPSMGGGVGGDYQYYFGDVIPPAGYGQPVAPAAGSPGYVTQDELRKVEEKANDSLRMHKKLQQKLQPDQPQQ
ncbi:MAG: hypothetical protein WCT10_04390 [Patescibacteria group bacterium]|jgi:hypothetical protein